MDDPVVYVVSDLHLSAGRSPRTGALDPLEDFEGDDAFCAFLEEIGRGPRPVELVIAGDFMEYPQTLPDLGLRSPADHLGTTEEESVERTRVIMGMRPEVASGHPEVFAGLRRFMVEGNSVTIIVGNHDIDLFWPRAWALVFDAIYPPGSAGWLQRARYSHRVGRGPGAVHIEHGHEHDTANRFGDQMRSPFAVDPRGVRRLKRCWGTLFVDKVYNQLERDRWFIDNIKPIPRVVQMGLRHDFRFTATALALITRFLLTSGLPPGALGIGAGRQSEEAGILGGAEVDGDVLGGAEAQGVGPASRRQVQPQAEEIVAAVADPELRAALEAQLDDPELRAALEQEMAGIDRSAWSAVRRGEAGQASLAEAAGAGPTADMSVLGGSAGGGEDAYRRAARAVLEADPNVGTVIMGHTHIPIDGYVDPVDLTGRRMGYYFNTGTWTRHLRDEAQRPYDWHEVSDPGNYTTSFTYLRLDPDKKGAYRATMQSWAAH